LRREGKKKIAASKRRLLTRDEIYVLAFTCFEISQGEQGATNEENQRMKM